MKQQKQWYFHAKAQKIDITLGDDCAVVIHEKEAAKHGITTLDKVTIFFKDKKTGDQKQASVNADLTNELVRPWYIGIMKDTHEKYQINHGDVIWIQYTKTSEISVLAIKKKLLGKKLTEEEVEAIIKDISDNKLSKTMLAYYVATSFLQEEDEDELFWSTKYSAKYGEQLNFGAEKWEIIADKHCIGGVPWNETTMILIPIIASLGIKIPKTFSKAITSPAATGECVEVLMGIQNNKQEIYETVEKTWWCLSWGGGLALAPANNAIMEVTYPIAMEPYSKMVSSITAKKYAMGVSHSLIDIPMGPTAKVKNIQEAQEWKQKFETVGKGLGMKMTVQITEANEPIGAGIGAVLQVREVLRVLQQHEKRPTDLEEKAVFLASKIIEIVGLAQGEEAIKLAYGQLVSGKAWEKMQQIIKVQAYNKDYTAPFVNGKTYEVKSEELKLAEYSENIVAESDGAIKNIDMKQLNMVTRSLGAPHDLQAGIYLHHKTGATIKKGEVLFTLYANSMERIDTAKAMLAEKAFIEM